MNPSFCIDIAGVIVRVFPLSSDLRTFCEAYLVEGKEEHTLTITPDDIEWEREHEQQKINSPSSDKRLEQIALCRKMTSLFLQKHDTLLVHGSCIAVDEVGYIFTATSGTGKSTHTRLWREMLGDRAVMVNDDKPFLKITHKGVIAYGSPWNGNHKLSTNIAVPLKAVCLISRDTTNHITSLPADEAYAVLLGQTYRPGTTEEMEKTLHLVQRLCEQVEFYSLSCNKEPEAAKMSYEAMTEANR